MNKTLSKKNFLNSASTYLHQLLTALDVVVVDVVAVGPLGRPTSSPAGQLDGDQRVFGEVQAVEAVDLRGVVDLGGSRAARHQQHRTWPTPEYLVIDWEAVDDELAAF